MAPLTLLPSPLPLLLAVLPPLELLELLEPLELLPPELLELLELPAGAARLTAAIPGAAPGSTAVTAVTVTEAGDGTVAGA